MWQLDNLGSGCRAAQCELLINVESPARTHLRLRMASLVTDIISDIIEQVPRLVPRVELNLSKIVKRRDAPVPIPVRLACVVLERRLRRRGLHYAQLGLLDEEDDETRLSCPCRSIVFERDFDPETPSRSASS